MARPRCDAKSRWVPYRQCATTTRPATTALGYESRGGQAVMLALAHLPSPAVLDTLPAPDAVLAHEILVPGHYAHEYLYRTRGLVLTVAQSLQGNSGISRAAEAWHRWPRRGNLAGFLSLRLKTACPGPGWRTYEPHRGAHRPTGAARR